MPNKHDDSTKLILTFSQNYHFSRTDPAATAQVMVSAARACLKQKTRLLYIIGNPAHRLYLWRKIIVDKAIGMITVRIRGQNMFDYVLKGGQVIDPKNKIFSKLNIGIKNGKINALAIDDIFGKKVLDCSNLIVSPGFVDIHMHEDPYDENKQDFQFGISECMLKMGVTSVIGGNCGSGPQNPLEYLMTVKRLGYPVNIGLLSAHATLRENLGDFDKYKNVYTNTINRMCEKLEEELEAGTLGISSGIRYTPGIDHDELLALC